LFLDLKGILRDFATFLLPSIVLGTDVEWASWQ
jgi:hypothetical protein